MVEIRCADCKYFQSIWDSGEYKYICWLPSEVKIGQGQWAKPYEHCDCWQKKKNKEEKP